MSPREVLSQEGDEEMIMPAMASRMQLSEGEANEATFLLAQQGDNYTRKRETWTFKVQREIKEQSKTFIPALQSMILSKIPWFITLRILGEMDDGSEFGAEDEDTNNDGIKLAAAALATTLCNVTGMSLCVGFSFALSTLAGQAKGEMTSRAASNVRGSVKRMSSSCKGSESTINTPVVFLLRGLMIQIILVLPVGIWWLFGIENFLISLGQTPELATHAATYLKILAPSLWVYSIQWTTTSWCHSIGMADVPAKASLLGLILHIPFNFLFCYILGMGYLGCAYATIMFQAVQCTYIVSYLFLYPKGRKRVLESTGGSAVGQTKLTLVKELRIAGGSIRGFCNYLGLALPGIVIISEWWGT